MKRSRIWLNVSFAILVGVFVFLNNSSLKQSKVSQSPSTNREETGTKEAARAIRVIDGDTIEVSLDNKKETVRLIGINAPETDDPRKNIECFGKDASEKAKEFLIDREITLESDPTQGDRDKYGRLLRYVFIDGENFNKLMINEGYAHEYTYRSNPYKYQLEFVVAEKDAREEKKGLWADGVCNLAN